MNPVILSVIHHRQNLLDSKRLAVDCIFRVSNTKHSSKLYNIIFAVYTDGI
jgi:hypothetical protein